MEEKKTGIPEYTKVERRGHIYYRKRIRDENGKSIDLYAKTCEELYEKELARRKQIEESIYRRKNPTVAEYAEKYLRMKSAVIKENTVNHYRSDINKYIVEPLGNKLMRDVKTDDIRMALVPLARQASGTYVAVAMHFKNMFRSAYQNQLIDYDPAEPISWKGGIETKPREALTDEQLEKLMNAARGHPVYTVVLLGAYAGLRREEILALQWDAVNLDETVPYITISRAWRDTRHGAVVSNELKSRAAKRNIPIPGVLVQHLLECKECSTSAYVVAGPSGEYLTASQYALYWRVRELKDLEFPVCGHQLRHTYITNLIHAGVDPKTVQYLVGHVNSKTTMDVYAKVKYNDPRALSAIINKALNGENTASLDP